MAQNELGLTLRIATKDTAKNLAAVELQLKKITEDLQAAKKAGDSGVYEGLRQDQLLLQRQAQDLRKEFRETTDAFRAQKFPTDSILGLKQRYSELTNEIKQLSTADPKFAAKASQAKQLSAEIKKAEEQIKDYNFGLTKALKQSQDVFSLGAAAFGGVAGAAIFTDGLSGVGQLVGDLRLAVQETIKLRGEVQRLTDSTPEAADGLTQQIQALANTFGKDTQELLLAANSLTDQLTGDFDQSIALLQQGFLAGADANGEFLDTVREYPAFFREAGLSGEQFISTISQSVKEGVFSDKGADLIKETTLRLREMTPATQAALEQLGISSEEIAQKIDQDGIGGAIQLVQEKLLLLRDDSPAVGAALADIFGGPGEDAGINFIKNLDLTAASLDGLVDSTNPYVVQQQKLFEANLRVAAAQAKLVDEFAGTSQQLELLGRRVLAAVLENLLTFLNVIRQIPAFLNENKITLAGLVIGLLAYNKAAIAARVATLAKAAVDRIAAARTLALKKANDLLNLSFKANPIGFILTIASALITAFGLLYERSQTVRAGIAGLGAVAQEIFKIVKESISDFITGFKAIKEGDFKGALQSFGNAIQKSNPIGIAFTQGERLGDAFNKGYAGRIAKENAKELEDAANQGLDQFEANLTGKSKEVGENAGKNLGEGLNRELGKTFKQAEAVAETSLAGIQAKIQELNTELEKAPDAESYAKIANEIERLEFALAQTQARFERFRDVQNLITTQLKPLATGIRQVADLGNGLQETVFVSDQTRLINNIIQTTRLAQRAEVENQKETQDALAQAQAAAQKRITEIQQEELDKRREQLFDYQEQQDAILVEGTEAIGQALGTFFGDTEASFKDLNKALLDIALQALEKTVLLAIAESQIKELASKGFAGILTGALITGLIRGIFAGIRSQVQRFATGGVVQYMGMDVPILEPGLIRTRPNIPRQRGGDNVLAMVQPREMILNTRQQRRAEQLFGKDIWKKLQVPGFAAGGLVPAFATGGVVASTPPQILNPSDVPAASRQEIDVAFDESNVGTLAETMASRVSETLAPAVERAIFTASERAERLQQLRKDIVQ